MTWQPSRRCRRRKVCAHYLKLGCCAGSYQKDLEESEHCNNAEWKE